MCACTGVFFWVSCFLNLVHIHTHTRARACVCERERERERDEYVRLLTYINTYTFTCIHIYEGRVDKFYIKLTVGRG